MRLSKDETWTEAPWHESSKLQTRTLKLHVTTFQQSSRGVLYRSPWLVTQSQLPVAMLWLSVQGDCAAA